MSSEDTSSEGQETELYADELSWLKPVDTPSKYLVYIPALLVLALVVMVQRRRAGAAA